MKDKTTLAPILFALVGLFANPVVSFAEDRVTVADPTPDVVHVVVVEKTSAAAGLTNLKTETGKPMVTSSERPTSVYKTVADLRAEQASAAYRERQETKILRNLASGESPHRYYLNMANSESPDASAVRSSILRLLIRASSGDRQ